MTQLRKHSIFIVDDDADDRASIHDAFVANQHHHDYVFMKNGDQLMGHFAATDTQQPSLILLDLNMPGRDGREILREIKTNEQLKLIPIVIMTTSSSVKDRETSYRLGANCFVTKPDTYNELLSLTDSIARLWLCNH